MDMVHNVTVAKTQLAKVKLRVLKNSILSYLTIFIKLIVGSAGGGKDELVKDNYIVVEETTPKKNEEFPWILFLPMMLVR